jgi:hypothetical protein
MQYVFAFALDPDDLLDVTVLYFSEGVTPLVPSVGDRIEYGSPPIVGNVRSREIRFMGGNPVKHIYVLFVVDRDETVFTGGAPKRADFEPEVKP